MKIHIRKRIRYYVLQSARYILLPFSATRRKEHRRLQSEIKRLKRNTFLHIDEAYTSEYFKSQPFVDELKYAANISQVIGNVFSPKSVVDVGCGKGLYLSYFYKKNIVIKGYEGSSHAIKLSVVPKKYLEKVDLRRLINKPKRYGIAISFEVAEHIEKEFVSTYLLNLTSLSDTILFTAAEPLLNPPHPHHPNEQFSEYWTELFKFYNYRLNDKLTSTLQLSLKKIGLPYKLSHYNNVLVYTKE